MTGKKKLAIGGFVVAEGILWLCFTGLDLFAVGANTDWLKFISISGCFVFSLGLCVGGGDQFVPVALFFTVGADVLLLLLDSNYEMGILLFCAVQGGYLLRMFPNNGRRCLWGMRILLFFGAVCGILLLEALDWLTILAAFYITNFFCNILCSFYSREKYAKLFSMGLCLFFCCDVCVGIFQSGWLFPEWLCEFAAVGMWLFYLPGQVLITLSGIETWQHPIQR